MQRGRTLTEGGTANRVSYANARGRAEGKELDAAIKQRVWHPTKKV